MCGCVDDPLDLCGGNGLTGADSTWHPGEKEMVCGREKDDHFNNWSELRVLHLQYTPHNIHPPSKHPPSALSRVIFNLYCHWMEICLYHQVRGFEE
ncbi:hypothetical protein POX_e06209 [Penicillium oxalicum]|uniref:hypothetical protein n=1 Tax=Penicillium oxalicum TaxID=69781 RepID=UPI0020B88976|nr:hypothetical protein POX_e06209 [Penicillium oxalicum]KAI2788196.1 hypothetical protein POX_e06209 [Penicillium oxalicum]